MALSTCRICKKDVSQEAKSCPHCGAPKPVQSFIRPFGSEYKSKANLGGIPLFHFAWGMDEHLRPRVARGIIAIGSNAVGVVSIGVFSLGLVGLGLFQLSLVGAGFIVAAPGFAYGSVSAGVDWGIQQMFVSGKGFGAYTLHLPQPWNLSLPLAAALIIFILVWQKLFRHWFVPQVLADEARVSPTAVAAFVGTLTPPAAETPTRKASDPALTPGTRLGPYVVEAAIGRGGMGAVYRARHAMLDRVVALKVLPASLASDPEFVERFKREAQALARLKHPHIVSVFDLGCEVDTYFFAMEYVEGANLRRMLKSGALPPETALALVPKICDALAYAHANGIVHRDIKPENILVGPDGEPKVADFGLARLVHGDGKGPSLTRTDAVMGTPDYMAPEQRDSTRTVDHRADIYSLGVVVYEMLTGKLPLGAFEPPAKLVQVDVRIDSVVLKAIEREPERRYESASAMGSDVREISSVKKSG